LHPNCSAFIGRTPEDGPNQYTYPTWPVLNYCYPDFDKLNVQDAAHYDEFVTGMQESVLGSWATDIWKARWVVLASIGVCLCISLIFIKLMDWFAIYLAWFSVFVFEAGLIMLGFYFWNNESNKVAECNALAAEAQLLSESCSNNWWGWVSCWLAASIYACTMFCFFTQLRQAIRVIETAADWLADTKRMVFVPLNWFFVASLFFMFWMGGAMCIGTIAVDDSIYHPISSDPLAITFSQEKTWEWPDSVYYIMFLEVFGMLWLMFFIMALNEFIVIVSAATWYYSDKTIKDTDGIAGDSDVAYGYSLGIKYHMGSLASGSLILAIVWIIRGIFAYIGKKMEDASGNNCLTKCLVGCCNCCLACFNKFIQYMNQQAYIYMAISGEGYCSSALSAFLLMTRYAVTFGMVHTITDVFIFIIKWSIAIGTTVIAFPLMSTSLVEDGQIV
jgi:solute carrier family 44 (choline transporter-like protein), member 2/4/5